MPEDRKPTLYNCLMLLLLLLAPSLGAQTGGDPAPSEGSEDVISDLAPEERREAEAWIRQWHEQSKELFSQLKAHVKSKEPEKSYQVLNKLHGGGIGVAASEYELLKIRYEKETERLENSKEVFEFLTVGDLDSYASSHRERIRMLEEKIKTRESLIRDIKQKRDAQLQVAITQEFDLLSRVLGDLGLLGTKL